MTEREHLLRALLEAPDDDTPRLVYADKLDELGGTRNAARAACIRVQVELARTPTHLVTANQLVGHDEQGRVVPAVDGIVPIGVARHNVPNPAVAPLRAREHVLLKQWVGAWLPKCLRPGYPGLKVEGETVWVDPLGGYVRFKRGFVAEVGCELPFGPPDEVPHAIGRFAARVRALFAANPLTGIALSFEGGDEVLYAQITQGQDAERPPHWRVMWDMDTYCRLAHGMIEEPVTLYERAHVGHSLERWLSRAVREPARAVALARGDFIEVVEGGWETPQNPVENLQEMLSEMQQMTAQGLVLPLDLFTGGPL